MYRNILLLYVSLIFFSIKSYAGINEKQKKIIKNQLFLMKEGMISKKDVFEKAKLFDSRGFFGINEDKMTEIEFLEFVETEIEFEELLEDEALNAEN